MEFIAKVNAEGKAYVKFLNEQVDPPMGGYDFIPFVVIDKSQIGVKKHEGFKVIDLQCQPTIELSDALDISKRNHLLYAIRFTDKDEVVVRFKVEQGNSNANDEDGILEARPYGVEITSEKTFNTEYNKTIELKVSSKNLKEEAYIDFYASDNNTFFDIKGLQNIHCGRVKILSNSKDEDVFDDEAVKRLLDDYARSHVFNNSGQVTGNGYCILSADKGIGALLNDKTNFYSEPNYKSLGGNGVSLENLTKRINVVKSLGYVHNEFSIKTNNYNTNSEPTSLQTSLMKQIEGDIKDKIGYHVYYYSMHGEYHVMTLLVDNTNPCHPYYSILDQGYIDERDLELKNIDQKFLSLAQKFWNNKNANAKIIQMYKIKKK